MALLVALTSAGASACTGGAAPSGSDVSTPTSVASPTAAPIDYRVGTCDAVDVDGAASVLDSVPLRPARESISAASHPVVVCTAGWESTTDDVGDATVRVVGERYGDPELLEQQWSNLVAGAADPADRLASDLELEVLDPVAPGAGWEDSIAIAGIRRELVVGDAGEVALDDLFYKVWARDGDLIAHVDVRYRYDGAARAREAVLGKVQSAFDPVLTRLREQR